MIVQKYTRWLLSVILFMSPISLFAQHQIEIAAMEVAVGDTFEVPVFLSSTKDISFIQMTVEYDSLQLKPVSPFVLPGADLGGLQLGLINTQLNRPLQDTLLTSKLLFQISGNAQSLTGNDLEIAQLKMVKTGAADTARIAFDTRGEYCSISTTELADIIEPELAFIDGMIYSPVLDTVEPKSIIHFPVDGAEFQPGLIVIKGSAYDSLGSGIASVELSLDDGMTWMAVIADSANFDQWHYDWQAAPGSYDFITRATDLAGNIGYSRVPRQITIVQPATVLELVIPGAAQVGTTIEIPLQMHHADNISFVQTTVEWDSSALRLQGVLIGANANGFSIGQLNRNLPFSTSATGTNTHALFQVAGNGVNALTGQSLEIAVLHFSVIGMPDSLTALAFDSECTHTYVSTAALQDICAPELQLISPVLPLVAQDQIDGHVLYYANNQPVDDVTITIAGPETRTVMTDQAGAYVIDELIRGSYTMTAMKSGNLNNAISASDALAIFQSTAFVRQLTPAQIRAGDVDRNGLLTGTDALAVLRYAAFFAAGTAAAGEWEFSATDSVIALQRQHTHDLSAYILG
ncbi:MAG: hypothetical protein DWQ10_08905, partial [Calditrichaeota bacterium]